MKLTKAQSGFFDTVRGGGAIYIAVIHTALLFGMDIGATPFRLGTAWLLAFFVLSGFVIQRAVARSSAGAFSMARMLRIAPPFIAAISLTLTLAAAAPLFFLSGTTSFIRRTLFAEFTIGDPWPTLVLLNGIVGPTMPANSPLWSLTLEIWLYVAAALWGTGKVTGRVLAISIVTVLLSANLNNGRFVLAFAAGWAWSVLHAQGRLSVPSWRFRPFERAVPFSYALYITHFPLLLFLYGTLGEKPALAPVAFAIVLALNIVFGPSLERSGAYVLTRWRQVVTPRVSDPPANADTAKTVSRT